MTEDADEPRVRLSKAERLEAKAAKLREAEAAAALRADNAAPVASRTGWIAAITAVSAALVLVLVLGLLYVFHLRDQVSSARHDVSTTRTLDKVRSTVLATATTYAVDFGSYDYRHLDADLAKVASHLTPSFAASYKTSSAGLKPTIIQYKGKSTATVQGVAVSAITRSSATVLVFLDQTVSTSQSTTSRVDRNRLQMKLVLTNGKWLIQNLLLK
jgi:Mce-associated membrane protein